ncbi:MAG: SRPBCC family protein, partial [Gammaproteobacteria bacterium]
MNTTPRVEVRVVQRYSESAGRVFGAWLDSKRAGRWLFATATCPMAQVRIDARVGGSFSFVDGN